MNEVVKQDNDVTILSNGDAYISQRKLAELCGVDHKSIQNWLGRNKQVATGFVNEDNQLSHFLVSKVAAYFAIESKSSNDKARLFLAKLSEAGAKAYLYHEAGYELNATVARPKTALELAKEQVVLLEQLEAANTRIGHLQVRLDESEEWLSIKRVAFANKISWKDISYHTLKRQGMLDGKPPRKVFDANYGEVNSYHVDTWTKCYRELMVVFENE